MHLEAGLVKKRAELFFKGIKLDAALFRFYLRYVGVSIDP